MKSLTKAIAVASLATVATAANAEVSVTGGVMSDYVFRGVSVDTGSGYVSVDWDGGLFHAGIWSADITDGLEIDIYAGLGGDLGDTGISWGIDLTRYEYTGGDSGFAQNELAVSAGIAGFSAQVVAGQNVDEGSDSLTDEEEDRDYIVATLGWTNDTWGVVVGMVDADEKDGSSSEMLALEAEYKWAEVSITQEVSGFDVTAAIGGTFDGEVDGTDVGTDGEDGYITFDISRSFDL
jgi:uncharacterized protein (TIGR02001 family)